MKKELDMRDSSVVPVNILKIIRVFKDLVKGDVLEVKIKDKGTKSYLTKFFEPSQIRVIEDIEGNFYRIVLKK